MHFPLHQDKILYRIYVEYFSNSPTGKREEWYINYEMTKEN